MPNDTLFFCFSQGIYTLKADRDCSHVLFPVLSSLYRLITLPSVKLFQFYKVSVNGIKTASLMKLSLNHWCSFGFSHSRNDPCLWELYTDSVRGLISPQKAEKFSTQEHFVLNSPYWGLKVVDHTLYFSTQRLRTAGDLYIQ